jgi:transposase
MSGSVFVFINRRRDRVKLLYFAGDSLVIYYRRLEKGTFRIPVGPEGEVELTSAELAMVLEGITPQHVNRRWRAAAAEA